MHRVLVHCKFAARRIVMYLVVGKSQLPRGRALVRQLSILPKVASVSCGMGARHAGIVLKGRARYV